MPAELTTFEEWCAASHAAGFTLWDLRQLVRRCAGMPDESRVLLIEHRGKVPTMLQVRHTVPQL